MKQNGLGKWESVNKPIRCHLISWRARSFLKEKWDHTSIKENLLITHWYLREVSLTYIEIQIDTMPRNVSLQQPWLISYLAVFLHSPWIPICSCIYRKKAPLIFLMKLSVPKGIVFWLPCVGSIQHLCSSFCPLIMMRFFFRLLDC